MAVPALLLGWGAFDAVGTQQLRVESQLLELGFGGGGKRPKLEAVGGGDDALGSREPSVVSAALQPAEDEDDVEEQMARIEAMKREGCRQQRELEVRGYCELLGMPPEHSERVVLKLRERTDVEQIAYLVQLIERHEADARARDEEVATKQRRLESSPHKVYGMVDVAEVIPLVRAKFNVNDRTDISLKHVRTELESRLGLCLKSQKARIRMLVEKFMIEERAELAAADAQSSAAAAMAEAAARCNMRTALVIGGLARAAPLDQDTGSGDSIGGECIGSGADTDDRTDDN